MITLTYEFKLETTPEVASSFDEWLEICRKVWNYALRERKDWVNSRKCDINSCSLVQEYIIPTDAKRPTYASQCKALTAAKKEYPDLKIPQSQVLQQVLRNLEAAFVSMWERGFGFPRFKRAGRMRSFVFPQLSISDIQGEYIDLTAVCGKNQSSRICLPKIGKVKMILSRPIPEGFDLKQARIVRRASGYYVMLSLQADARVSLCRGTRQRNSLVSVPDVMPHGYPIGIDVGLNAFVATSEGETIARPKFFVEAQRQLKSLQRRLKHKKKGGKNWHKLNRKIARRHEYISNQRKDFHFKTAHHLCSCVGMIFAEDLNLKAMSRGMLSKHTLDAAFGQFLMILGWVCWKRNVFFLKVDANGTSQVCPACDTHVPKDLSVRIHNCPFCGYRTNRDVASATVVKKRGLAAVGHTVLKLPVEGDGLSNPVKQENQRAIFGIPRTCPQG